MSAKPRGRPRGPKKIYFATKLPPATVRLIEALAAEYSRRFQVEGTGLRVPRNFVVEKAIRQLAKREKVPPPA